MDFDSSASGLTIAEYQPTTIRKKYQIEHPHKLCVAGSLSYQPLPPLVHKKLKVFKRRPQLLTDKVVSGAQIEAALQAMSRFVESPVDGLQKGFYLGDQTGCGKSAVIALVIFEMSLRGEKKALWISANKELGQDAEKELNRIQFNPEFIKYSGKSTLAEQDRLIKSRKDGVLFTAYSTLRSGSSFEYLFRVCEWLGPKFKGVIVLDECHSARNETQVSKVVKWLHLTFPWARFLYVSATVGTEPHHLSYMSRVGLWGTGCPFADVREFERQMSARGLTAMELISNHLQSTGSFVARQLDVSEVKFLKKLLILSEKQKSLYDASVEIWQDLYEYMRSFECNVDPKEYWCRHQRFFDALILTFKSVTVSDIRREYPSNNFSIVVALQSTGYEAWNRVDPNLKLDEEFSLCRSQLREIMDKMEIVECKDAYNLDLSDPSFREKIAIDFAKISKDFGRNPLDEIIHGLGGQDCVSEMTGRVGKQVPNIEGASVVLSSRASSSAVISPVNSESSSESDSESSSGSDSDSESSSRSNCSSLLSIPETGINDKMEFNSDNNGPGRLVTKFGGIKRKYSNQTQRIDLQEECKKFMDGSNRAAVISQKGATGISLHSDSSRKNQTKRVQLCMQVPWIPENAIQQLGRTNRTNQVSPPLYIIVHTDIPGESRFIMSFEEKLAKMGAICQGERKATRNIIGGRISNAFSESPLNATHAAQNAVQFFMDNEDEFAEVVKDFGAVNLLKEGKFHGGIHQFLNRLLGMRLKTQHLVLKRLNLCYESIIDDLRMKKLLDAGMIGLSDKWSLYTTGIKQYGRPESSYFCKLYTFKADRGLSWESLMEAISMIQEKCKREPVFFINGKCISCCYAQSIINASSKLGSVVRSYKVYTPWSCEFLEIDSHAFKGFAKVSYNKDVLSRVSVIWNEAYEFGESMEICIHKLENVPCREDCTVEARNVNLHVLRGCLLNVWDVLKNVYEKVGTGPVYAMQTMRVKAIKNGETEKFVGLYVPRQLLDKVDSCLRMNIKNKKTRPASTALERLIDKKFLNKEVKIIRRHWKEYCLENRQWDYSDSEDSDTDSNTSAEEIDPPTKKRKVCKRLSLSSDED